MDFKLPNIKQSAASPKNNVSSQGLKKLGKVKLPKVNHEDFDNHKNIFASQPLFGNINTDEEIKFEGLIKALENLDFNKNNKVLFYISC